MEIVDEICESEFIISLSYELEISVWLVGTGEKIDDIEDFDAKEFVEAMF